jgi:hypothetical protein
MVALLSNMKVLAGTHAPFTSQISGLVNMESMLSFRKLGKSDLEARSAAF